MCIYVYVGIFVHIHFVYICIYVFAYMYVSKNIYMYICMYISHTTRTTSTQVQRWCTGLASLSQVYLQSTVWVERLLQEVTFLWHLVREIVCGELSSPSILPFLTQALQQVCTLATNILQKLINSHAVVEVLYTYQIPFNHQIKG